MFVSGWFMLQFSGFQNSDTRSRPTSYRFQLDVKIISYSACFYGIVFNMTTQSADTKLTYRKRSRFIVYQI